MPRQRFPSGPLLDKVLGHYIVSRRFVPAGTTLAGILWSLRNPTASVVTGVLLRARLRALQVAAPTAAIEDRFNLKVARAFTVAETTNGTDISPAAAMQKNRTTMSNGVLTLHESAVAAGITGGTKTLDTNPIATGSLWVLAALPTGEGRMIDIFDYAPRVQDGEHPVVLAAEEGVQIANENAFGATSGIILQLETLWAEATRY